MTLVLKLDSLGYTMVLINKRKILHQLKKTSASDLISLAKGKRERSRNSLILRETRFNA